MRALFVAAILGLLSIGSANAFLHSTPNFTSGAGPTSCTIETIGTTVTIGVDVDC